MIVQGRSTASAGNDPVAGARAPVALTLVALVLSLLLVLLAPPGATAAGVDRDCGTLDPVYGLRTFNDVRCRTADTVAFRLANRFDRPSRFRGHDSSRRITQRDQQRRKWRCRWQSADIRNRVILWVCKRGPGVITWAWRADPV